MNVRDNKDAAGNSNTLTDDSVSVIVNVTDVNETPAISIHPRPPFPLRRTRPPSSPTPQPTRTTANNQANDAGNTLTWSVETADDGRFLRDWLVQRRAHVQECAEL